MRLYRALVAYIEALTDEAQARADIDRIEAMGYQFDATDLDDAEG
jgi:hypothetical protein